MKIKSGYPPNITKIRKYINIPDKDVIFTYGDIIFNPDSVLIDLFVRRHEEIHCLQQGNNPKKWWKKYLKDVDFRLSQELEAYQQQYILAKKHISEKNKLNELLHRMASDLSSEMYGNIITFAEAILAIKNKNSVKKF